MVTRGRDERADVVAFVARSNEKYFLFCSIFAKIGHHASQCFQNGGVEEEILEKNTETTTTEVARVVTSTQPPMLLFLQLLQAAPVIRLGLRQPQLTNTLLLGLQQSEPLLKFFPSQL